MITINRQVKSISFSCALDGGINVTGTAEVAADNTLTKIDNGHILREAAEGEPAENVGSFYIYKEADGLKLSLNNLKVTDAAQAASAVARAIVEFGETLEKK